MKKMNLLIPIVMVVLLVVAWFSVLSGMLQEGNAYDACLQRAQESVEQGLYEQAIECYKEALTYGASEELYLMIRDVHELLFAEEHTAYFRTAYINDMAEAAGAFPDNDLFWLLQAQLYMDGNNPRRAFNVLDEAKTRGVAGEELDALYQELCYMVRVNFRMYSQVKTVLNGYHAVFDGSYWQVLDDYGDELTGKYNFIGLISNHGKGLYTNDIDTRLMDSIEVPRARYDITVEEAGYFNENVDLMPVKINGVWKYMRSDGSFLPGEFEMAGSFDGPQAVAYANGQWILVDDEGGQTALPEYEDIKLDLYVCHIQGGVILARENGKYHIYDTSFQRLGDFEADDMDICIDMGLIAFARNGKWGFVDAEGNVVVEPQYAGAKSFANGFAAVCNEEGLWGFINEANELVIDYAYLDACYFTPSGTCWVSQENGSFQLLEFMF